jgi:lysozyme family protein
MSTARFKRFEKVLDSHEGNYANTAGDTGGETYRGISRRWNPQWQGWAIIDAYKKQVKRPLRNNELIKNNTLEVLIDDFYFANFYNAVKAESIKNESIALTIYDHALGVAPDDAVKFAQRVLNANFGYKLAVDGKMGIITLNAINVVDQKRFFDLYNAAREAHYRKRAKEVPNQAQFLNSWLSRLSGKLKFTPTTVAAVTGGFFLSWLEYLQPFIY